MNLNKKIIKLVDNFEKIFCRRDLILLVVLFFSSRQFWAPSHGKPPTIHVTQRSI